MIHVQLPDAQVRRLPFYLALEEWLARTMPADDYFFTWRVRPTVIFGRNQLIDTEVDLDYCRNHGIEVYRRKSGGGCVYADMDNIMMSLVTPRTDVQSTFAEYTARVADMLRRLGLDAHPSGRNDVLIGDRKVSGNAYYRLRDRSIVHGTMLYSTDIEHMLHAITPSRSKLESKQVKSVASRIVTVSECCDITLDAFTRHITTCMCGDRRLTLTPEQLGEVAEIERGYYAPDFIYGRRRHNGRRSVRIEGVGEIGVYLELDARSRISHLELTGDYLLRGDLDWLTGHLLGRSLEDDDLHDALRDVDVDAVIAGLDAPTLASLIKI